MGILFLRMFMTERERIDLINFDRLMKECRAYLSVSNSVSI